MKSGALEALQDVWIRAFRGIRRLKDPGSLRPWLYRMTHGIVIDRIRRDSFRQRAEEVHTEGFSETAELTFDRKSNRSNCRCSNFTKPYARQHRESTSLLKRGARRISEGGLQSARRFSADLRQRS
jgi:DNA-directed RNA polymerase specialized sigma24 family protein